MSFGITARFPLGTYQGHGADGRAELLPDPARLHAALLCAAAQGTRAMLVDGRLEPSGPDRTALEWLERNPPNAIARPAARQLSSGQIIAYRKDGVIRKEVGDWKDKVTSRAQSDGAALGGPIGWSWPDVPGPVKESLEALCADVSCLGEASSPVVLEVGAIEATHELRTDLSPFDPLGTDVRVPEDGRTRELQQAHRAANRKEPTLANDRHSVSELPTPSPVVSVGLSTARYVEIDAPVVQTPWDTVHIIPLADGAQVRENQCVDLAVAVHRALISRIGTGAAPEITGAYEERAARPANRLAIHIVSGEVASAFGLGDSTSILLLLPTSMSGTARVQLNRALSGWSRITWRGRVLRVDMDRWKVRSGQEFWPAPATGFSRAWITWPVAIPETRPQRVDGRAWTLADAAAVSAGMVWRDLIAPGDLRGGLLYRRLHEAAVEKGFRVGQVASVPTSKGRQYAHAVPADLVVQPYRAWVDLGQLAGSRSVIAIGQSRHLGGGLLIPVDVADPAMVGLVRRERGR